MNTDKLDILLKEADELGCKVVRDAKLKKYTTFKTGGAVPCLFELDSEEKCVKLISTAARLGLPYYILGNGSNIIADDRGVDAVVFRLNGGRISCENGVISCFAGVKLTALCNFALDKGLGGLEFAYGIPGSVGGAVYMNAGAYGGEIKDVILSVRAMDKEGNIHVFDRDELGLSYRKSVFMDNGHIILSADFALSESDRVYIKLKMEELMEKRRSKQPLEYPSAGSTFKRPEGSFASLLIEQCGLKGFSVGGAQVSEKHSGFVINKDNAKFDDIIELMRAVRKKVKDETGYTLECEPVIISDREIDWE